MKRKLLFIAAVCMAILQVQGQAQNWDEIIKSVASDRAGADLFGFSVSVSGDYAIVGARLEDEDASGGNTLLDPGSAYIFKNTGGTWTEVQKIVA